MKEQIRIPSSKVERASRFLRTGVKVGGNYVKYYSKKMFDPEWDKQELDTENAADIYETLSQLKGSALKVAQMMSMDQNIMPKPYQDKFMLAQYSAPPLSLPLVVKTFQKYLGKTPLDIFDKFTPQAVNAASIGQVHQAELKGKKLAVKIQYPGVADSVSSDLKMVRPFATRLFNISSKDLDKYFQEIEGKLLEETDYELELDRSLSISQACKNISGLMFPRYFPKYSCGRILTMEWLPGQHLREFLKTNPSQSVRNQVGQALWDFYDFQIHVLKQVHADPHPGNFLIQPDGTVGVIDFGCVKEIPEAFYQPYFALLKKDVVTREEELMDLFYQLEFISDQDTEAEKSLFAGIFTQMIGLLGQPFHHDQFDFGDNSYFKEIYEVGEKVSRSREVRSSRTARGSRHGLYINRTYYGLYNILNELKAVVKTRSATSLALSA
ncbi:MAG: ABC1 kinase family protein [Candidatus Cyclobacteriaceae bacterium M3_2C_046]